MKKLLLGAVLATAVSCASADTAASATVIRDCTGTYLRIDAKDYLVCNESLLKPYATNSAVSASYSKVTECKELEGKMVCMMYHENEGTIRITSIK